MLGNYKVILFDLDGTISDPKIGITKSVQYGLKKMNIDEPDIDKLEHFIGPPLRLSFEECYGFTPEQAMQAIGYYRERFEEKGMYENTLYDGIRELLATLKEQGYVLAIATSKPTVFAKEILRYFELQHYFDFIGGSNLDETRSFKWEVIEYVMQQFEQYTPEQFIMIGDRKYDINGAKKMGIDSIGVTYGYGSQEELQAASANYIIDTVKELQNFFIK